jgi:hypothetical protein
MCVCTVGSLFSAVFARPFRCRSCGPQVTGISSPMPGGTRLPAGEALSVLAALLGSLGLPAGQGKLVATSSAKCAAGAGGLGVRC